MSHGKLLVGQPYSKVGQSRPAKTSHFSPVFSSVLAKRGTVCVPEDMGRKTLHLVSSAFLAAAYLELLA